MGLSVSAPPQDLQNLEVSANSMLHFGQCFIIEGCREAVLYRVQFAVVPGVALSEGTSDKLAGFASDMDQATSVLLRDATYLS